MQGTYQLEEKSIMKFLSGILRQLVGAESHTP